MASSSIASTEVLLHLHSWQRRAGVELTWPVTVGEAYRQQWQAIFLVLEQASTTT